jgi:hypothetical protein
LLSKRVEDTCYPKDPNGVSGWKRVRSLTGSTDLVKDVTPRFSGISIAREFRQRHVESLPLSRRRLVTPDEVSLIQLGEPGEQV